MDALQEARKIINEVDEQMAALFCRRMEAAAMVAAYKKVNPILLITLSAVAGVAIYYLPTLFI